MSSKNIIDVTYIDSLDGNVSMCAREEVGYKVAPSSKWKEFKLVFLTERLLRLYRERSGGDSDKVKLLSLSLSL